MAVVGQERSGVLDRGVDVSRRRPCRSSQWFVSQNVAEDGKCQHCGKKFPSELFVSEEETLVL